MKLQFLLLGIVLVAASFLSQKKDANFEKEIIEIIDSKYWEGCETGQGECKPLTFTRKTSHQKWFLKMPCGGTLTDVILTKEGDDQPIQIINISYKECPPIFELTSLSDGKYFARMFACGLGGRVEFHLKTE